MLLAPSVVLATLLGASATLLSARDASACVRPAPREFSVDPALRAFDSTPPSSPGRVTATASRTSGSFCGSDGLCTETDCGSGASVQLEFVPAQDDLLPADELGYRLSFVEGFVPPGFLVRLTAIQVGKSPLFLELPFESVVTLDATFALVAIDRAGNESAASEPFQVRFDGCTRSVGLDGCVEDTGGRVTCSRGSCVEAMEQGCTLAPGGNRTPAGALSFALGIAASALLLRQRRARPVPSSSQAALRA